MNIFKKNFLAIFFIFLAFQLGGCADGTVLVIEKGAPPYAGGTITRENLRDQEMTLVYVGLEKSTNYGNCSVRVLNPKSRWRDSNGWSNARLANRINGLTIRRNWPNSKRQAQAWVSPGGHELLLEIYNHQTGERKTIRKTVYVPRSSYNVYRTVRVYTGSFCQSKHYSGYDDDCRYHHGHRCDHNHYRSDQKKKVHKRKGHHKKKYHKKKKKKNKKRKKRTANKDVLKKLRGMME